LLAPRGEKEGRGSARTSSFSVVKGRKRETTHGCQKYGIWKKRKKNSRLSASRKRWVQCLKQHIIKWERGAGWARQEQRKTIRRVENLLNPTSGALDR